MENRILQDREPQEEEILAVFGEAQLVKVNGRIRLRGGSMADRTEALEWLSLFMPDEVVRVER